MRFAERTPSMITAAAGVGLVPVGSTTAGVGVDVGVGVAAGVAVLAVDDSVVAQNVSV